MKKYILGTTITGLLSISLINIAMESKKSTSTNLSSKEATKLRQAIIDYKNNKNRSKQEKIINKYKNKYPNDPLVKAKLNEKARFDNPQMTKKEPVTKQPVLIQPKPFQPAPVQPILTQPKSIQPITQPKPIQPKPIQPAPVQPRPQPTPIQPIKKEQPKYEQLDILLDQENSRGQSFIDWDKVLTFIDQNNINVNDYHTHRAPDPYADYPVRCGYDKTLLYLAIYYNQFNVVKSLLEKYGANIHAQQLPNNITNPQLVLLLAQHGVQFGQTSIQPKPIQPIKREQPKSATSRQNNPQIYEQLDILLDQENSRGQSFIDWDKVLTFIDQNNINVNNYHTHRAPDPYADYPVGCGYDKTLLYLAIYYNQFNVVKLLLEKYGANIHAQQLPNNITNPQMILLLSQYGYQF